VGVPSRIRIAVALLIASVGAACSASGGPGAPSPAPAAQAARPAPAPNPGDVHFMQGMIHHHAQALEMTALIPDRTTSTAIRQMGLRMEISQTDEIALMERWLRDRGLEVPTWRRVGDAAATEHGAGHDAAGHDAAGHDTAGHGAGHTAAGHANADPGAMDHTAMDHGAHGPGMPGMLTPEQLTQLIAARGVEFDRLFLELMIQHHQGALVMVRDLYNSPGAAQESLVYHFASEVDADQDIEIRRMLEILQTLP